MKFIFLAFSSPIGEILSPKKVPLVSLRNLVPISNAQTLLVSGSEPIVPAGSLFVQHYT